MPVSIPPLAVNDIVLYSIFGRLAGQQLIHTFHYKLTTVNGDPYTEALDAFLAFQFGASGIATALLPIMPSNYRMETHRAQVIFPTRRRYVEALIDTPGAWASAARTPNTAMSIKRIGLAATRQGVGRLQVPIGDDLMTNGTINLAGIAAELLDIDTAMELEFTPPGDGNVYQPVLFGKDANGNLTNTPIIEVAAMTTVRTMHRRTVGLGI